MSSSADQHHTSSKYVQDPIAVVGMACRLPGDNYSPHALWKFLMEGGIADNDAPESRFNLKGHFDGSRRPKTMRSPGGMFLENIDPQEFDAAFFGISKTDAIAMDPQQRQLLEVVYECLENAGVKMESIDNTPVGCFVGSYGVDYADMQARDPEDRPPSVTIGVGRAILSNRISHFFNLKGPSMTIDTACSGSLVGLDVACRYLQSGEINGAVVAGANLYLSPEHNLDSGAMKAASSPSGKCHTFDVKADGYIKAEAINALFVKRLSDAIRDRDPIRAVIRGIATNSDGRTPGIASPSAEAQAAAIRAAYANAGLTNFNETRYLECHGTGTQAGDPQEVQGLSSVFSHTRSADQPLVIGSIKSNIGHSEPAAGISGMLKAIMIVENGSIPGNPTFVTPNPKIEFETLKVKATRTSLPWPQEAIRRVSVNSFGYGGSNAHAVVEEPKVMVPGYTPAHKSSYTSVDNFFDDDDDEDLVAPKTRRPTVLLFSANKENSLRSSLKLLRKHLLNPNVKISLPDLAYTLSERRTHHFNRGYLITKTTGIDETSVTLGKKSNEPLKIGLVFTGQGAQWSQMGKELVELFPELKSLFLHFDDVLKSCSVPPSWSFLDELTQPRDPAAMRRPEFSQPLVTALQLAILTILRKWGLHNVEGVIGHSSGEIAAAHAAGLLTQDEAILVAYYRGQAAKAFSSADNDVGMLAVGLGEDDVKPFIEDLVDTVQIACYNSPSSLTLSGKISGLQEAKTRISEKGHFARLLQVDLAYHSRFMAEIAEKYSEMLSKDFSVTRESGSVSMFSTVHGHKLEGPTGVNYWISNLLQPVKFVPSFQQMVSAEEGINFLIELGPSGALAGPISQILKAGSSGAKKVQYYPALKRGQDSVLPLFDLAGRLFLAGGDIDFTKVNEIDGATQPSLIVDLPNYSWEHSTKYWYENDSSKDWRNRLFPAHELLGSKILGTTWHAPSWKQTLSLDHLPWLKDHRMGSDIVFPGAGFIALAVEAIRQKHIALNLIEESQAIENPTFRIRDIAFPKALVLTEGEEGSKITVSLAPTGKAQGAWQEFKVLSSSGNTWVENCYGLVRIEADQEAVAESAIAPLVHPVPGSLWYKAMQDVGYNFGPLFQKQLSVECFSGKRQSRSIVSLEPLEKGQPDTAYALHPISIDGCFQTCAPSLWNGNRSSVCDVLIPAMIGEIVIPTITTPRTTGVSITSSRYSKLGRVEETKNYVSEASVYDQGTGRLVFRVSGFQYHKLDVDETPYSKHKYSHLTWKPDISHLSQKGLTHFIQSSTKVTTMEKIQEILDLFYHKQPALAVLELNNVPKDEDSLWLIENPEDKDARAACSRYAYGSIDATALVNVQQKYPASESHEFAVLDIAKSVGPFSSEEAAFDLAIVRVALTQSKIFEKIITNVRSLLKSGGQILFLCESQALEIVDTHDDEQPDLASDAESPILEDSSTTNGTPNSSETPRSTGSTTTVVSDADQCNCQAYITKDVDGNAINESKQCSNCAQIKEVVEQTDHHGIAMSANSRNADQIQFEGLNHFGFLTVPSRFSSQLFTSSDNTITVFHFRPLQSAATRIMESLGSKGWNVVTTSECSEIKTNQVIVLDELSASLFPDMQADVWGSMKKLTNSGRHVLWVTQGAQMQVSDPEKAMIFGLARTVRAEDPSVKLTCLDIESESGDAGIEAIHDVARSLRNGQPKTRIENEFVERNGTIFVGRIRPDHVVNDVWTPKDNISQTKNTAIHEADTLIRLTCTRVGNIDSLVYTEIAKQELPIRDNCVEVEIAAAGLNFKDVAVTMGIVPENEHLLGLEGAGTIKRIGKSVTSYQIGQRVLVFEKGTFANRIEATTERVYPIPDSMTFEEASTLASVYLTSLYSIYDLGGTKKGDKVLLHSASGGLGIACIQICQYIGTEIFCTVGTDQKRKFLRDTFGIPDDHIFNSRTTAFADEIMRITDGYGVDLILNSLTGDLLDASWRCVAEGGNMIELGKRDMLDRKSLAMEPFGRNASYRCFDMAHKHVSDILIARLLKQLFGLIEGGWVKPINPIEVFSFENIQNAFRYMRGANHIGKIVITRNQNEDPEVPVVPARPSLKLRDDVSYLIIGGLRGLCGSLAIDMARQGAKNLVVMSRSGYDDSRSQGILKDIKSEGCTIDLIKGDVSSREDVKRAFTSARLPIGGVVQGAMVLRDTIFDSMTLEEYSQATRPKVQGTWNIHNIAIEENLKLDFFTLLSSVSGVVGQKGQANYAAANAFLDSFSSYRHGLGMSACSVDLGAVDDVGYMSEHKDILAKLETEAWTPINESLFLDIVRCSILQQIATINPASASQMITSVAIPQREDSYLMADARFSTLCFGNTVSNSQASDGASVLIRQFLGMIAAGAASADMSSVVNAGVEMLNTQLTLILRLGEPMEPAKALSSYGLDSLAAVEIRNWIRAQLSAEVTVLDITGASSLVALVEKIVGKLAAATAAAATASNGTQESENKTAN